MKSVAILGSTGSIGASTLDVIARHPDRFRVAALTARERRDLLLEQCRRFRPALAVLADADQARQLADDLRRAGVATEVATGEAGLTAAACAADIVMAAIVGDRKSVV